MYIPYLKTETLIPLTTLINVITITTIPSIIVALSIVELGITKVIIKIVY